MEKKLVYVVLANKYTETDGNSSDVLGVFDNEKKATEVAKSEIDNLYAIDLQESYDNDEESLVREIHPWGWSYHSRFDFYEVEVGVYQKEMNVVDVHLEYI